MKKVRKPGDVALDLWSTTQTAQPHDVERFAKTESNDPAFVRAVILEYSKLQSKADDFRATVDRMPD